MSQIFKPKNEKYLELIRDFNDMNSIRNLARSSLLGHHGNILEFFAWIENQSLFSVQDIRPYHIWRFVKYLEERPNLNKTGGLTNARINSILLTLQSFFNYLVHTNEIGTALLIPRKKRIFTPPEIVTESEMMLLFDSCKTMRDKAILSCAYGAGLRRTEIERLDVSDIDISRAIHIRDGKGHKRRSVVLSSRVAKYLDDYINVERLARLKRSGTETNALIINNYGNRMTGFSMSQRLKMLIRKTESTELNSKSITLHCLRTSIAVHLVDRGAELKFVQRFLGHSSINTTQDYVHHRKQKHPML